MLGKLLDLWKMFLKNYDISFLSQETMTKTQKEGYGDAKIRGQMNNIRRKLAKGI